MKSEYKVTNLGTVTHDAVNLGFEADNEENLSNGINGPSAVSATEVQSPAYRTVEDGPIANGKPRDSGEPSPPTTDYGKLTLWTQILGCSGAAFLHLGCNLMFGYTGIVLPSLTNSSSGDLYLNREQSSIFASIITIGSLISCFFAGPIVARLGQRKVMVVVLPIGILSWIVLSQANSYWLLILTRFILGAVTGLAPASSINYVVEVAHSSLRGRLMAVTDLSRQIGLLYVFLVGSTSLSWRVVALICGITSLGLPLSILIFMPDSPRWLATKGRFEDARKSLDFYRGKQYNVSAELNDIKNQLESNKNSSSLMDQLKILKDFSILKRVLIMSFLLLASHLTGNFAMMSYAVTIYESAQMNLNPYLSTIMTACVRIVGGVLYLLIADKFGRRVLSLFNISLSAISLVILSIYFYLLAVMEDVSHLSWLPLVTILAFNFFFCMAIPVVMLLRGEIIPTSVRSLTGGILDASYFMGAFIAGISYPAIVDNLGHHWVYVSYVIMCVAMILVIYFFIPETKGKSLEEIERLFDKKK